MTESIVTCIYVITYHNLHSFLYNLDLSFAAPSTIDTDTGKNSFVLMNDLPEIGYPYLRKELWNRQGANTASHEKEMYSRKMF